MSDTVRKKSANFGREDGASRPVRRHIWALGALMRSYDVVPLWADSPSFKPHVCFLSGCDAVPRFVFACVQAGSAMKALFRSRGANKLQDRFVAEQRAPSPVATDQAEHAVIDGVPFAGSGGKVGHDHYQAKFIGQALQGHFPCPFR
jgi:hypothetical protein